MENLLQIDIFRKKVHCVYKVKLGSKKCSKDLVRLIYESIDYVDANVRITIYGTFNLKGEVFFEGNVLVLDLLDIDSKECARMLVNSENELTEVLRNYKSGCKTEKLNDLNRVQHIILCDTALRKIIALTQQYFMLEKITFDKEISVYVNSMGKKDELISKGESKVLLNPITSLCGFHGLENVVCKANKTLHSNDVNNMISGINLKTGTFFLSLDVIDHQGKRGNVYLIRKCKDLWQQMRYVEENEEELLVIDRGEDS